MVIFSLPVYGFCGLGGRKLLDNLVELGLRAGILKSGCLALTSSDSEAFLHLTSQCLSLLFCYGLISVRAPMKMKWIKPQKRHSSSITILLLNKLIIIVPTFTLNSLPLSNSVTQNYPLLLRILGVACCLSQWWNYLNLNGALSITFRFSAHML